MQVRQAPGALLLMLFQNERLAIPTPCGTCKLGCQSRWGKRPTRPTWDCDLVDDVAPAGMSRQLAASGQCSSCRNPLPSERISGRIGSPWSVFGSTCRHSKAPTVRGALATRPACAASLPAASRTCILSLQLLSTDFSVAPRAEYTCGAPDEIWRGRRVARPPRRS